MQPPRRGDQARLYAEVEQLSEQFHARLVAGEDADGDLFMSRREAILASIQTLGADGTRDGDACAAAIRRIVELDRRIVALLRNQMAGIGRQLTQMSHGRRSLASYRGPQATTPAFLDRRS